MNENKSEFEPKIVAFVCNWCTYAGADLTGTSRLKYATNVEIVRFPCTGRIDFMLLLKAFAGGADGIICSENLLFLGIGSRRSQMGRVSQSDSCRYSRVRTLRRIQEGSCIFRTGGGL